MEKEYYISLFDKYLDGYATSEEIKSLIKWLKADDMSHKWSEEQWTNSSSEINPQLRQELFVKIKEKAGIVNTPVKTRILNISGWLFRGAAVLLLLLATGAVFYFNKQNVYQPSDMLVTVEKGQKANIMLPDGSKVWINSDSELKYGSRFDDKERTLELTGEAYFEVAPDKDRPFTVNVGEISVTALGTSFNIKSYGNENDISMTLMSGKIEVASAGKKIILNPNEQIIYNKESKSINKLNLTETSYYTSWRQNTLHFEAETFENIAKTLERYYNTKIVFESESLKENSFTGTLGNTSLESILQILSLTSPLSYEISNNIIYLRENTRHKEYYERATR